MGAEMFAIAVTIRKTKKCFNLTGSSFVIRGSRAHDLHPISRRKSRKNVPRATATLFIDWAMDLDAHARKWSDPFLSSGLACKTAILEGNVEMWPRLYK
jgi:hypothetical protein